MSKIDWIKDLVYTETHGVKNTEWGSDDDYQQELQITTTSFLRQIKESFIDYISSFNQLRGLSTGGVKIYGIANTISDFMLFRNGYKLIFSSNIPGEIRIKFTHHNTNLSISGEDQDLSDTTLSARYGAFGEIIWTHKEQFVKLDYLAKYYLTLFTKKSVNTD